MMVPAGAPARGRTLGAMAGREFIFTRDGVRRLDGAAHDEFAIPTIVLMENAAFALERACIDELAATSPPGAHSPARTALILCGPGNNGGDGLALARHLHNAGVRIGVALSHPSERARGDAGTNLEIVRRMGLALETVSPSSPRATLDAMCDRLGEPALLIDALLGTGADRAPGAPIDAMIAWLNARRAAHASARVVAVDIPSGLGCDSGVPLEGANAVRADLTVTLAGLKAGFRNPASRAFTGRIVVGDIGAPRELLERFALSPGDAR